MKKQIKIWKSDFDRYWDKTSLVVRILIGAVISLILTYIVVNKINRPLSEKVGKERKAISDTAVVDGAIYILEELRQKRDKVKRQLGKWEKKLEESQKGGSSLTSLESSKVIIAVRELFYKNKLKLLNEQKIKKNKASLIKKSRYSKRHQQAKPNTRIKLKPPEYIEYVSYQIKAYGQFSDVKKFFYDIDTVSHVFIMNNIAFVVGEVSAIDHKFHRRKGIEINFELHIPYLKTPEKTKAKAKKK